MTDHPLVKVTKSDDRATLEGFLDYLRDELVDKVSGVSEGDARRRLVPSLTTLGGLLKHMTAVEDTWFVRHLGQPAGEELPPRVPVDEQFVLTDEDTVPDLVRRYREQCATSRRIAAGHGMDDLVTHRRIGELSLRWMLTHMVQETARHVGHADILREQLDAAAAG